MKILDFHKASLALDSAAHRQFLSWYHAAGLALMEGRQREHKIFKAKALVVATTNCPLRGFGRGEGPEVCQPGHIERLQEADLDLLIADLETSSGMAA